MRAPLAWLDAAFRYSLPIATILALAAAAVLILPITAPGPQALQGVAVEPGLADPDPDADPTPPDPGPSTVEARLEPRSLGLPALVPLPTPTPRAERPLRTRPSADLPVLMYHHVGNLPPNPDAIRRDLTVSPANFERQLAYMAETKVRTVHLNDLMDHLAGRSELPSRAVVLTFDDGYDDNYQHAFPLLKKHGMVGTFFITTDFIGKPGYMTWAQIEEMALGGMSIQAHSLDHSDLTKVSPAELKRQLAGPKQLLEERLGQPVRFLAYPAGKYNRAVIVATHAAGYEAAVTVQHGTVQSAAGPYELVRVRARGSDSVDQLASRFTPASWRSTARQ